MLEFTDYKNLTRTQVGLDGISGTFTIPKECKHKNGWYGTIPFWIFSKQIFACSDCGTMLYGKKLIEWKKRKKIEAILLKECPLPPKSK